MTHEYRIKVFPEQKKESVTPLRDGRLVVRVNAKRQEGRANARAVELVAAFLEIPSKQVHILSGHNQSTKTISVRTSH